jgi:UDP-N-acetylglucosamine transferase subunit ALG13
MIFITTGSRSFQFDRLLKAVDIAVENGEIKDDIFAQVGSSKYKVKNYKTVEFLNHEEFNRKMSECDIVLTHGGTGVIVNAVKMGKRVVAVPRLAQYQEAVDDHQIQLVQAFEKLGMVTGCYDCEKIGVAITTSKEKEVKPYVSNTQTIIESVDSFIAKIFENMKILVVSNMFPDSKHPSAGIFVKKFCDEISEIGINYDLAVMKKPDTKIKKIKNYLQFYIGTFVKLMVNRYDVVYIHYASHSSIPVLFASK